MLKFIARFYLGLVAALGAALLIATLLLSRQYEASLEQENIWLTRSLNSLIQQQLAVAPPVQWPELIQQMTSDYPFVVAPASRDTLSGSEQQQLQSQGVAVRIISGLLKDDITLFYPITHLQPGQLLRYQASSQLYAAYGWILLMNLVGMLIAIGVSIWWLARPLVRHVHQLATVSRAIGAGQLDARADEHAPAPLGPLARDINGMAAQIDQLLQEQEAMTGAVAHELRTPIANLRFALDLTRNSDSVDQLRTQIAEMDVDIDALDALVDELLTYARLRQTGDAPTRQWVALQPMLAQLLSKLGPLQPDLQYTLECDDLRVRADERDLLRAVSNLLRNAQAYAHTRVRILVRTDADCVSLSVDDDGPGIALAQRKRVLLPFTRLDQSRSRSSGGFGLGLAIVQRIAQQHQARLQIEDSDLGGTRVRLLMPR